MCCEIKDILRQCDLYKGKKPDVWSCLYSFLYKNGVKSGIYGTGSENFKTGSKVHDQKPNFHVPKNDIYGSKIP